MKIQCIIEADITCHDDNLQAIIYTLHNENLQIQVDQGGWPDGYVGEILEVCDIKFLDKVNDD